MPVYDNDMCGIGIIEIITYKDKKSIVLRCNCKPFETITELEYVSI